MATNPTFDELLDPPTQDEALDGDVLPELVRQGLPTSDWSTGDPLRVVSQVTARLYVKGRQALAGLGAASVEDYVFGTTAAPNGIDVTSWAPVVAEQRYNIERIAATYTRRTIRFTNATGTPYGPYDSGDLIVEFTGYDPPDNRYVLDEDGVTIAAATTTDLEFRSEFAVDSAGGYTYAHASGSTIILTTAALPGVTVTNPAGTFTDVALSGTSTGTLTPSGTPGGLFTTSSWAIEIQTSGQTTVATWRYRALKSDGTYSGWTNAGAVASVANAFGSGVTLTLANHASVTPSFIAGDVFRFAAPGSDVIQAGRDLETPQDLGIRCRGMWFLLNHTRDDAGNALPKAPSYLAYEALVRSASDQVVHVDVATGDVNNEVIITVAGQGSALAPATITALQSYLDSLSDLTDLPVVESPTLRTITLAGGATISVSAALLSAAQAALQSSLDDYFQGLDAANRIGLNPRIDRAYLVRLVRGTAGVTATTADTALTINGAATDLQLPVTPGAVELAKWTGAVTSVFTWVPV